MELKSSVCPDYTTNKGLKPLESLFLDYLELNGNHQSLMRWRDDNYTRLTKDEIEQYKEFFFSSTNSKEISYKW